MRSLRPDAFEEDPSRVVRAARYAGRLGFVLEADTEQAARRVAPGARPGHRPGWPASCGGFSRRRSPRWRCGCSSGWACRGPPDPTSRSAWTTRSRTRPRRRSRGGPLASARSSAGRFLERAALPGWAARPPRNGVRARGWRVRCRRLSRPSEVDRILRAAPPATQAAPWRAGADVVERWWERDRDRRADIDGSDLVAAGIAPGPAIGRALAAVRAAVLDGAIGEPEESRLQLALRVAREHT